jgi:hypothetical protein
LVLALWVIEESTLQGVRATADVGHGHGVRQVLFDQREKIL